MKKSLQKKSPKKVSKKSLQKKAPLEQIEIFLRVPFFGDFFSRCCFICRKSGKKNIKKRHFYTFECIYN